MHGFNLAIKLKHVKMSTSLERNTCSVRFISECAGILQSLPCKEEVMCLSSCAVMQKVVFEYHLLGHLLTVHKTSRCPTLGGHNSELGSITSTSVT